MMENIAFDGVPFGPDLSTLGQHALVPFTAHKAKSARVLWLNRRRLSSFGIDLADEDVQRSFSDWLIESYAFCVRTEGNAADLTDETAVFHADRYGTSIGSYHGGSGRCGIRGRLNVKGIGITPLAARPDDTDWWHGHGCMWIEECFREAIWSEVADREFPHGAVPVLAVIDLGIAAVTNGGSSGGRRGMVVRPNFVRISHLERSIYFGGGGSESSAQVLDQKRVHDAFEAIWGPMQRRSELHIQPETPLETMLRVAEQVAYSRAHRLFLGGIASSNITLNGELADFGGLSSVNNWARTFGAVEAPPFGEEWEDLKTIAESLLYYLSKNLGSSLDVRGLMQSLFERLNSAFPTFISAAIKSSDTAAPVVSRICDRLHALYRVQQRRCTALRAPGRREWLGRYLAEKGAKDPPNLSMQTAAAIRSEIRNAIEAGELAPAAGELILERLRQWALARPYLHWVRLDCRARRVVLNFAEAGNFATHATLYIERQIEIGTLRQARSPALAPQSPSAPLRAAALIS